jgi:hypothetical protein
MLNQQNQSLIGGINRTVETTDQTIQQGACDVVRNIGHNFVGWYPTRQFQGNGQHVSLLQGKLWMASKGLLKPSDEVTVKLHRMDGRCR